MCVNSETRMWDGADPQRTKSVMLLSREEVAEAGSPDTTSDAWG